MAVAQFGHGGNAGGQVREGHHQADGGPRRGDQL